MPEENRLRTLETEKANLDAELEAIRTRLIELEDIECQRISEEQERFDALHVLDEYAQQLEETRDKLARLLRAGAMVQAAESVQEVLQRVANAVGEAGWGSVSADLFKDFNVALSAYFQVTPEDINFLETNLRPAEERARWFGPEYEAFRVSRSYFIPADRLTELFPMESVCPGRREVVPGDNWNPMDLAYVPIYGTSGDVIGAIYCDDPIDGSRPTQETFLYLELFADLAARKMEMVSLLEQQNKIEAALRQSEQKYRTLFDRSADSFFVMDGLFHDCNSRACEMFECEREDIIEHPPWEFSPEFQPDGMSSMVKAEYYIKRALGGEPQTFDWVHQAKTGKLLFCEVSLAAVNIGESGSILAIVRDNTDRKRDADDRETISIVSQLFLSSGSLDLVYSQLPKILSDRCQMEYVALELYDSEQNTVVTVGSQGIDSALSELHVDLSAAISDACILREEPLCISVGNSIPDHRDPRFKDKRLKALIAVPMKANQKVIGSIILADEKEHPGLNRYHITLQAVASYLAQSIDRCRADESRENLKTFYVRLLDNLPAQIAVLDPDGRYRYVNRAGIPDPVRRRWIIGKTDQDYSEKYQLTLDISLNRRDKIHETCVKRSTVKFEETLIDRHGRDRYFVRVLNPVIDAEGGVDHLVCYGMDVTDRVRAEHESKRIAILPDEDPNLVMTIASSGKISYRNQAAEAFAMETGAGELSEILPPQHRDLLNRSQVEHKLVEFLQERSDGRVIRWHYQSVPASGSCNVYAVEISGPSKTGQEMVSDERTVELLGPVCVLDSTGALVEKTDSVVRLQDELGLSESLALLPDTYPEMIALCLSGGAPEPVEKKIGDRTFRWQATRSHQENRVCFAALEVTELRRLEHELRHAQKMESIGRLTSGVAHDFNNLLTGIMGNIDMAQQYHSGHTSQQTYLREAAAATDRAVALVRQLLAYSRKPAANDLDQVCANAVCRNVISMLSRTVDRRITLVFDSDNDCCPAKADANRLEQIVMNLCVNAADAILEKHRSGSSEVDKSSHSIRLSTRIGACANKTGEFVIIKVKDDGCGMTEETKQSLFDPYYTTKSTNNGTGLGLSIVREIIDELDGHIDFKSETGVGTEFTICIPAAKRVEASAPPPVAASVNIQGGTETVLVVDDEEVIRTLAQEVLEIYGYHVITASDGQEAIEVFERDASSIDLAILDVCMPRMSGDEALPLMLQKKPELKIILCSGFGQDRISEKNLNFGSIAFLNKPYHTLDLVAAVRDVLDHSDAI